MLMTFYHYTKYYLIVGWVCFLSGCFEIYQTVSLLKDGGGTFRISLHCDPACLNYLQTIPEWARYRDPKQMISELEKIPGVKITTYRVGEGKRFNLLLEGRFSNLSPEMIKLLLGSEIHKKDGDSWMLVCQGSPITPHLSQLALEKGIKFQINLEVPERIIEVEGGTLVNCKQVSWDLVTSAQAHQGVPYLKIRYR